MTRIPPLVMCCVTLFVIVGEKACGTDTYFVAAVGVIFLAAGITYNLLGGLGTISGILFTEFALRTIVISQFVKIFFREAANTNLDAPALTITAYAFFFCSLALASTFLGRLKLQLPRPIEPQTAAQTRILYLLALIGGAIGTLLFAALQLNPVGAIQYGAAHSIGFALRPLLFLAIVLAIDEKIRQTAGRHSFGWSVAVPVALIWVDALVNTSREEVLGTVVLYGIVCYTRGFRFRKRHLLGGTAFALFFMFIFSPFELYSRGNIEGLAFSERAATALRLVEEHPKLSTISANVESAGGYIGGRWGYFSATSNNAVQRMATIRTDSALISACASGFRYGWTSIRLDLLYNVPRFIRAKPETNASDYVGLVSGLNGDFGNAAIALSAIGDSFAGFGIPGVIVLGTFVVPVFFVVYQSIFDIRTVWGTMALAMVLMTFGEWRTGEYLNYALYDPLLLIGLSWVFNAVAQMIPTKLEAGLSSGPMASISAQPDPLL